MLPIARYAEGEFVVSQMSLFTDQGLVPFSDPWPRSGSMRNGIVFQRQPLALLTGGNESSLLPTPRTSDQNGPGLHGTGGQDLRTVAAMLPTPTARDWKGKGYEGQLPTTLLPTPTSASYKQGGTAAEQTAIKRGLGLLPTRLLPTPRAERAGRTARVYPGTVSGKSHARQADGGHGDLEEEAARQPSTGAPTDPPSSDGKPSQGQRLSPWFVEWMMGTPLGFTDPDCRLSAMEFKSRSRSFWGG